MAAPLYRQLRPSKKASADRVVVNQRLRLQGAMIEAVARHGYQGAGVDEIVGLAGVSTTTLYKLFGSKLECFLCTWDLVVDQGVGRISAAYGGEDRGERDAERDWRAGLLRAFEQFAVEVVEQPAASRLALVEVLAVGPAALSRVQRREAVFAEMIAQSVARAGDGVILPEALLKGVVHGLWFVARIRLTEGREGELAGAGDTLLGWLLCYRHPGLERLCAPVVQDAPPAPAPARAAVAGGRARRAQASQADRERDDRMTVLHAAAELVADEGYAALSIAAVARHSGVPLPRVAAMFDGPGECFLAAFEMLSARALARATRRAQSAGSWPESVCLAVESLYCGVPEDRVAARIAFVEVFAAGPVAARRQAALMGAFAEVLLARVPRGMDLDPLVAEAIAGAVWGIAHDHVLQGRAHLLPGLCADASYLTLAPLIGARQAIETIETWQAAAGEAGQAAAGSEQGQPA